MNWKIVTVIYIKNKINKIESFFSIKFILINISQNIILFFKFQYKIKPILGLLLVYYNISV